MDMDVEYCCMQIENCYIHYAFGGFPGGSEWIIDPRGNMKGSVSQAEIRSLSCSDTEPLGFFSRLPQCVPAVHA